MILVIRALGRELLHVNLSADSPSPEPDDKARDLSGGNLESARIEVDGTDRFMGFTNGRESD